MTGANLRPSLISSTALGLLVLAALPASALVRYRSIGDTSVSYGTFPPATLGNGTTVSVWNGLATVDGVGATTWQSDNRGRGDVITIPCPDPPTCTGGVHYTIYRVVSNGSLQLTQGYGGADNPSISYLIRRQFATPQDWENCIDGQGSPPPAAQCYYFPAPTNDLVNDDRSEVGIVYDDGIPYPAPAVDTAVARISGATTDASHTITLTADGDNRHYGVAGEGVLFLNHPASTGGDAIEIRTPWVTVEWIEITGGPLTEQVDGIELAGSGAGTVTVRNNLVHDIGGSGIQLGDPLTNADVYNNIVYDVGGGGRYGIDIQQPVPGARIFNNTIFRATDYGIRGAPPGPYPTVLLRNNLVRSSLTADYSVPLPIDSSSSHNLSGDATATDHSPGGFDRPGVCLSGLDCVNFKDDTAPGIDLHLQSSSFAIDKAADLSGIFGFDIDAGGRTAPWDIGADDFPATTEVVLVSLQATAANAAVELTWETASELRNLGFHLHRATAEAGPYTRITSQVIPGLGSSPHGARYRYVDPGLSNGTTYFYKLEDIETTGLTTLHGPVSATPSSLASGTAPEQTSLITYGDPDANSFRIERQGSRGLVIELVTEGFHAEPQEDGSVRIDIPGFEALDEIGIPVVRPWVDALTGRDVRLASIRESWVVSFSGLRPAGGETREIVASRNGTVSVRRGRSRARVERPEVVPEELARLLEVGFQGDVKKARLELAPVRWDGATGEILLARRLMVHLTFRGAVAGEGARRSRERNSHGERNLLARLSTTEKGLYEVRYEELFRRGRGIGSDHLRLSHQGKPVPFHVEPGGKRFGPGSRLYFLSEGEDANPYGQEAVYELEVGEGLRMGLGSASPSGEDVSSYLETDTYQENRYYQAGLLEAPDLWLWDILLAPVTKSFTFVVSQLVPGPSNLEVWMQGVSDFASEPDHHVRLYVNGAFHGEASWEGKRPQKVELLLLPGSLKEGENQLEIENVGDTGAEYSMVMLDRFELTYPRTASTEEGRLEGVWLLGGTASVYGLGLSHVLDVSEEDPRWLSGATIEGDGRLRFGVEEGKRYLAVSHQAVFRPLFRSVPPAKIKKETLQADYVVIGPSQFSSASAPLLGHRSRQGLKAKFVSLEDVFNEFGFGETRPEAIRDFLEYAYHRWQEPRLRYVLLLGDATFDFKDYLKTGVRNRLPPSMVKTSYLWTVSDPSLAAVNGQDLLPDMAVGRLPADNPEELEVMVSKILAYESGGTSLENLLVLVTDNPDRAGDFERNAEEIAQGVLGGRALKRLHLGELGGSMRSEIRQTFDDGASLVSYIGHGGIQLWAGENVFNTGDVASLSPQAQQPLVLTMNCLNGYFHFPYFDSLAEELLLAEGKGAIAAFSPSGLSLNEPAHLFHQALLEAVFEQDHPRLGDAILAAQSAYAQTGVFSELLLIYHLLGDPALPLR